MPAGKGKTMLSLPSFLLLLSLMILCFPGQAGAQNDDMPTVDCSAVNMSSYYYCRVDCSSSIGVRRDRKSIDASRVLLLEHEMLPRFVFAAPLSGELPKTIQEIIQEVGTSLGIDPGLIKAVALAESGGNHAARSPAGAIGIMQLMPETAHGLGVNPYNLEDNIRGGALYLRAQIEHFGSLSLALAAYNAGPGTVKKYGGIPPFQETRKYITRVMAAAREGR